jgi:aspartyl/glutamyl-tRNA(Asn/Gln) amidotransferase C subunit
MTFSRSELEKIAALAQLELSDEEAEGLTRDCQSILDYFEVVREIGTPEAVVNGLAEPAATLREDSIHCDPLEEKLESLAPDWREDYFILPRLSALDADG